MKVAYLKAVFFCWTFLDQNMKPSFNYVSKEFHSCVSQLDYCFM